MLVLMSANCNSFAKLFWAVGSLFYTVLSAMVLFTCLSSNRV